MESSEEKARDTLAYSALSNSQDALHNKKMVENMSYENPAQLIAEMAKMTPKGSPRFGALSHHSFFSRHNPHPHRVTHIQGLNGNPVCTVNDDWYASTPLFPHPLIKSQVPRTVAEAAAAQPLGLHYYGTKYGAALLSEAWRWELKDLAAKVSISAQAKKDKKDACTRTEEGVGFRRTQYSAQTGRIIPPSSRALSRCSTQAFQRRPGIRRPAPAQALYDQELMVLELLCQILQTDSLFLVQQWLLLAGEREKELVMGLIQQAMADSVLPSHLVPCQGEPPLSCASLPAHALPVGQRQRKQSLTRSCRTLELQESIKDRPERIGGAEVLQIHSEESSCVSHSHTILDRDQSN